MSALFIWSSRRLTLAKPPDLPWWPAQPPEWQHDSQGLSQRVLSSLSYQVLATTSSGTTAATELQPQQVFRLVCFVSVLSVFTVFPVFMVLKSIGAGPEPFTPLLCFESKLTFSHHALSEIFKGSFNFFKNNHSPQHCQGLSSNQFQKGVSWDHIQRIPTTTTRFMVIFVLPTLNSRSTTLWQADHCLLHPSSLEMTRILKTHSVVLEPLLRNDVACSPWVYQPAGLRISYPYTTYKTLQCAAQVVCHRSLSTRCPWGPLWPTSIWFSLHCKDLTTIAAWFPPPAQLLVLETPQPHKALHLLQLLETFLLSSTFATAFAAFALCSRLCLGLCNRLGCWGSSRSFAGILGPAVLSCMTWLAAMAAFHRLWAITSKVSTFAAVVASDTFRTWLWPCCHMNSAVQVIGESHSGVVRDHRLPNPGNSGGTTVELNIFCHLLW